MRDNFLRLEHLRSRGSHVDYGEDSHRMRFVPQLMAHGPVHAI